MPFSDRVEAPATPEQKRRLSGLSPQQVLSKDWPAKKSGASSAAHPATTRRSAGLKVVAESGWFAARPSGTEDIYKIYAESFRDAQHLRRIADEAQAIVDAALAAGP